MGLYRRLFIPDSHFGEVDKRAFELMLDIASEFRPHEVVYLGDFFDLSSLSSHEKDVFSDVQYLKDELEEGRNAIRRVEKRIKAKSYVFLEGNHEHRLRRYISNRAPQLAGILSAKDLFGIPENYKYLEFGQGGHYRMGELVATHGTLAGQYPASAHLKKYNSSVIHGHTHRLQVVHTTGFGGKELVGISAGWLGNAKKAAQYIKDVPDWQLGFVLTQHDSSGRFWYQIIHIKPGKNYESIFGERVFQR